MIVFAVALAGGCGAALRFLVDGVVARATPGRWPLGTFVINVSGSLALGFLVGALPAGDWLTILGTGLLGGYTTFSTASFEAINLAANRDHGWPTAAAHATAMMTLSLAAAWLGLALA
jgi:CrcB protein